MTKRQLDIELVKIYRAAGKVRVKGRISNKQRSKNPPARRKRFNSRKRHMRLLKKREEGKNQFINQRTINKMGIIILM